MSLRVCALIDVPAATTRSAFVGRVKTGKNVVPGGIFWRTLGRRWKKLRVREGTFAGSRQPMHGIFEARCTLHEFPGTPRRRPLLCTSVSVIGLSLAVSKERMEVKNRGCDTLALAPCRRVPCVKARPRCGRGQ
eukprot:scaffold18857_cov134-Isochrysis_galbana.AAC.4